MWTTQAALALNCSSEQFKQAVNIWILKPHTVNRRLIGAKIVFEDILKLEDIENLSDEWLFNLVKKLKLGEDIRQCLEKKDCNSDAAERSTGLEIIIRELIPKQFGRFHASREIIIKDYKNCEYTFLPLLHTDENDTVVHLDETMGYRMKYSDSEKQLLVSVTTKAEEPPCKSQGISVEWLKSVLIPKIIAWSQVSGALNTDITSLKLVPVDKYTLLYQQLKEKHGKRLVQTWPESTDPRKFVYEDVAIATYLILLWEEDRLKRSTDEKQCFVDLGCGNGLLVHILTLEGYKGKGIDIRKRKIWDMYGSDTHLEEDSITPDKIFSKGVWLIGNHSDELTPWIPVMSARSQCNFFLLPCCPWDFTSKFSIKPSGISLYRSYLDYVIEIIKVCGYDVSEDVMRIPSTKRICFVGQSKCLTQELWQNKIEEIQNFIQAKGSVSLIQSDTIQQILREESSIHLKTNDNCDIVNNLPTSYCNCNNKKNTSSSNETNIEGQAENEKDLAACNAKSENICCSCQQIIKSESNGSNAVDDVKFINNPSLKLFKPRQFVDENRSHCVTVDSEIKNFIVKQVFDCLLSKTTDELHCANNKIWNPGGTVSLAEVVKLFNNDTMQKLKSECGGIQTLLRNHHHIFMVQGGNVKLRDWANAQEHDQHQMSKKKRKGQHLKNDSKPLTKTKLCYFNENHPNGCPLDAETCRFAHGKNELRSPGTNVYKERKISLFE